MSTFGEKVRKRREEMELSQDQLASLAGITRRSIVNYETDVKKPFFSTLRKLAAALGVTIYYLQHDEVEDPQANLDEEPYIQAARDAYGKKAQEEMASILTQTEALFAGGTITEDQKDILYQALSQAYFRLKERTRKKYGRKETKIFEPYPDSDSTDNEPDNG